MATSFFISFEGGEGAGKSTQVARLAKTLETSGHPVLVTREPGGSTGAEAIRSLMVEGDAARWDAMTELLLANAARRDHVTKTIMPALEEGYIVLCDRFVHSTLAYQAGRDGVTSELVRALHRDVIGDLWPNLTFVFDLDTDVASERAERRDAGKQGRFEAMGRAFHVGLRERFLRIAEADECCIIVDASQSIDALAKEIWQTTEKQLP